MTLQKYLLKFKPTNFIGIFFYEEKKSLYYRTKADLIKSKADIISTKADLI